MHKVRLIGMYAYNMAKKEVAMLLRYAGIKNARIEKPPKNIDADFAYPCFEFSKTVKKNPASAALELKDKIGSKIPGKGIISRCDVLGPYINFYVNPEKYSCEVIENISDMKEKYGSGNEGNKKKLIVEYVSANPIHPLHIGSARNAILGKSLTNLYPMLGYKVASHYYLNDIGLQVAKVAFGYIKIGGHKISERPDVWLGKVYAITSAIISDDAEVKKELKKKWPDVYGKLESALSGEEDIEDQIKAMLLKIEKGDLATAKLFREIGDLCIKGFRETFERVGIKFDSYDYESMFIRNNDVYKVIDELKKKRAIKKTDEGTWIIDFEKYDIPSTVVVRSDGTTLYLTRDIAYSIWKFEKANADKVINVIASEQELPQKQLKTALKIMGKKYSDNLYHLSYGLVNLPGIKMSGRKGRYITFDYVLDEAISKAYEVVNEKNPGLPDKEKKMISTIVGKGAVIYSILKVEARKDVTFDMDEALDFNGNSAPYIQYTYARAKSILRKAGKIKKYDAGNLVNEQEQRVLKRLSAFPEIVKSAGDYVSPHIICNYLFELAQEFNNFYNSTPILKGDAGLKDARLALVLSVAQVIKIGLGILEIESLEKM